MSDKADQAPWEDEPYRDKAKAQKRALEAARWQAPGRLTDAQKHYAEKAFQDEIRELEAESSARNNQLNLAAFNLSQFVAAGALDEHTVRQALTDACHVNRHAQDDGMKMVLGTIESGFNGGLSKPRDLSHVTEKNTGNNTYAEPGIKAVKIDTIPDIEAGFWDKRDSLRNIYLAALSRLCSPWAVLGYCAARALATVRPHVVLPPVIGRTASLNWFAAVAAPSGGGKGSAAGVAREMVDTLIRTRNLGSGEGLIDAFVRPADKLSGEPAGQHEAVMFLADEIDTMHILGSRTGATLPSILRSAFSGERLGFSNRTASSRHLEEHEYRLTLVVNVQPAKAGALLDDSHGGTLQRFMWFPGIDKRVSAATPDMPGPLWLPSATSWLKAKELKIPYAAKHLIVENAVKRHNGETDAIDGHALIIREKFAFALAVLDGRDEMTEEDWRLAGTAMRVSDFTRTWVAAQLDDVLAMDAQRRGELRGVEFLAADEKKIDISSQRMRDAKLWAWTTIKEAGSEGIVGRDLHHKSSRARRPYLARSLNALVDEGHIAKREIKSGTKGGRPGTRWVIASG